VSVKVIDRSGQPSERTFPGEWGLFKLLQEGGSAAGDNSYAVSIRVGPANVRATLRPSSAVSPFDRTLFTNLRAPRGVTQ
jgi:type VI protein secretion system component VasK